MDFISIIRPRYKKLVKSIFPANDQAGIVDINMDKLLFYAITSPEKIDRIGKYLTKQVVYEVNRRRDAYICIALQALDQLLRSCHGSSSDLLLASLLKTVNILLDTNRPLLQMLAVRSFITFANMDENIPSYHLRYVFFASKFASLSRNDHLDPMMNRRLRIAGLIGIQGIVRKTLVSNDVGDSIWKPVHMNKIVPSILYNVRCPDPARLTSHAIKLIDNKEIDTDVDVTDWDSMDPSHFAEIVLGELMSRVAFANVDLVIRTALKHSDACQLWLKNDRVVHIFRLIMLSTQVSQLQSYMSLESIT